MSVQRWAIIVDNALRGVTEVRKVAARDGEWVEYQAHAAEVARLTAWLDESKDAILKTADEMGRQTEKRDTEIARLRGALESARDALKDWGSYAGEYFQQKHGLANDIAAIDAALAPAARKDPS